MTTLAWQLEREDAETRPCPPPPHGCGAPTGVTCRNVNTGRALGRQPAHSRRRFPAPAARQRMDRELVHTG